MSVLAMERSFFMSTSYPTALSNLSEVSTTDTMDAHRELHNSEIQSLNALETKVGIDGSADTNSIDYKINNLTLSDITDVTASVDEINYVDGVTSAIQTQLDAKASKITSGVENNIVTINNAENIKDSGVSIVDEDDMASDSATKLPTQQSVKAYVDSGNPSGGWIASGETWTYASADDPTFTFTIAGVDLTAKYSAGMRIKLTQTTVKYFIITAVAFSTDTTITVYGGTDYDLANAAITSPYYSREKAPHGFPLDIVKWTQRNVAGSATQASPTANTWYNLGGSLAIPIGSWRVVYHTEIYVSTNSTTGVRAFSTLSTANNSESDTDWTRNSNINAGSANLAVIDATTMSKNITVTSKTTYYLNVVTTSAGTGTIGLGQGTKNIIEAICAYL